MALESSAERPSGLASRGAKVSTLVPCKIGTRGSMAAAAAVAAVEAESEAAEPDPDPAAAAAAAAAKRGGSRVQIAPAGSGGSGGSGGRQVATAAAGGSGGSGGRQVAAAAAGGSGGSCKGQPAAAAAAAVAGNLRPPRLRRFLPVQDVLSRPGPRWRCVQGRCAWHLGGCVRSPQARQCGPFPCTQAGKQTDSKGCAKAAVSHVRNKWRGRLDEKKEGARRWGVIQHNWPRLCSRALHAAGHAQAQVSCKLVAALNTRTLVKQLRRESS